MILYVILNPLVRSSVSVKGPVDIDVKGPVDIKSTLDNSDFQRIGNFGSVNPLMVF